MRNRAKKGGGEIPDPFFRSISLFFASLSPHFLNTNNNKNTNKYKGKTQYRGAYFAIEYPPWQKKTT